MPYDAIWADGGCVIRWWCNVRGWEIVDCVLGLPANPRFDSARWLLHDFSPCDSISINRKQLMEVAAYGSAATRSNEFLRVALVPRRPEVVEAFAMLGGVKVASYERAVFETRTEAFAWLRSGST